MASPSGFKSIGNNAPAQLRRSEREVASQKKRTQSPSKGTHKVTICISDSSDDESAMVHPPPPPPTARPSNGDRRGSKQSPTGVDESSGRPRSSSSKVAPRSGRYNDRDWGAHIDLDPDDEGSDGIVKLTPPRLPKKSSHPTPSQPSHPPSTSPHKRRRTKSPKSASVAPAASHAPLLSNGQHDAARPPHPLLPRSTPDQESTGSDLDPPRYSSVAKGKQKASPEPASSVADWRNGVSTAELTFDDYMNGLERELEDELKIGASIENVVRAVLTTFNGQYDEVRERLEALQRSREQVERMSVEPPDKSSTLGGQPSSSPTHSEVAVATMLEAPITIVDDQAGREDASREIHDAPMDDQQPLGSADDAPPAGLRRKAAEVVSDDEDSVQIISGMGPPTAKRPKTSHPTGLPTPSNTGGSITISSSSSQTIEDEERARAAAGPSTKSGLATPSREPSEEPIVALRAVGMLEALGFPDAIDEADLVLEGELAEDEDDAELPEAAPIENPEAEAESKVKVKKEDDDPDDDGAENEAAPTDLPVRVAKRVVIVNHNKKNASFDKVQPGSAHRFCADVGTIKDANGTQQILSNEILDATVRLDIAGVPRLVLETRHAWYRVESVQRASDVRPVFVSGVLAELISQLGEKARLKDLQHMLAGYPEVRQRDRTSQQVTSLAILQSAGQWLASQSKKSGVAIEWESHVLKVLDRLIPELERIYLDSDYEPEAFPRIFNELVREANKRQVKLQPVKPPRAVVLPLVLDRIAFLVGNAFGAFRSKPLPSPVKPELRSSREEEVFVECIEGLLEDEYQHIDWNAPRKKTSTGVKCQTNGKEWVEVNIGDCVAIDPNEEEARRYGTSGPLSKLWYAQILDFRKKADKPVEVKIVWFNHSSSRMSGEDGYFFAGPFADPRELVRTEAVEWKAVKTVLRTVSVEEVVRFPTDPDAFFFSRLTIRKKGEAVSTASLKNPRPLFHDVEGKVRILDAYSGAGGLATGMLRGSGGNAELVYAIEKNEHAARSYQFNHPRTRTYNETVSAVLERDLDPDERKRPIKGPIHMVQGGPPCQDFSTANSFRHNHSLRAREVLTYLSFALSKDPEVIVMENVVGIKSYKLKPRRPGMSAEDGTVLNFVVRVLLEFGYQAEIKELVASDFGSPQARRRIVLIATKLGSAIPTFPKETHGFGRKRKCVTVWDAISDLHQFEWDKDTPIWTDLEKETEYAKEPQNDFQRACRQDGSKTAKYHTTPSYGTATRDICLAIGFDRPDEANDFLGNINFKNLPLKVLRALGYKGDPRKILPNYYKRLNPYGQFPTIIGSMNPSSVHGCVLHPFLHRVLTLLERARAQGFPDNYVFLGGICSVRQRIGDAVPIQLAEALGKHLFKDYEDRVEVVASSDEGDDDEGDDEVEQAEESGEEEGDEEMEGSQMDEGEDQAPEGGERDDDSEAGQEVQEEQEEEEEEGDGIVVEIEVPQSRRSRRRPPRTPPPARPPKNASAPVQKTYTANKDGVIDLCSDSDDE